MYDDPSKRKTKSIKVWMTPSTHDDFCETVNRLGTDRSRYGCKAIERAMKIDNCPLIAKKAKQMYMTPEEFVNHAIRTALHDTSGSTALEVAKESLPPASITLEDNANELGIRKDTLTHLIIQQHLQGLDNKKRQGALHDKESKQYELL